MPLLITTTLITIAITEAWDNLKNILTKPNLDSTAVSTSSWVKCRKPFCTWIFPHLVSKSHFALDFLRSYQNHDAPAESNGLCGVHRKVMFVTMIPITMIAKTMTMTRVWWPHTYDSDPTITISLHWNSLHGRPLHCKYIAQHLTFH